MPKRLSHLEFLKMLEDPHVEDEQIAEYLQPIPGRGGFSPTFEPNPDLVEPDRFESAITAGNWLARQRRRGRFRRRVADGVELPVLVSEGDSWFQFPFLIKDVIDHLEDDYLIWCGSAAGDTADNMIFDNPEYMKALDDQADQVCGFLFSAAGNDVIGEDQTGVPVLSNLLHRRSNRRRSASELINKAALSRVLDKLREGYLQVVATVRADVRFKSLPILIHGYDYPIPYPGGSNDRRSPTWADKDEWLGAPMTDKGITEPAVRREIAEILIQKLYEMLAEVAKTDANVHLVDVRSTLKTTRDWADEIHGTSDGFRRISAKFRKVLDRVVTPRTGNAEAVFDGEGEEVADAYPPLEEMPPLLIETRREEHIDPERLGFSDMGKFASGFRRTSALVSRGSMPEAIIDEDDSVPFRFLQLGADRGRAVCKIQASGVNFRGRTGRWSGTGFLVAPNILLTNHHVINSASVAAQSSAVFNYQETAPGVLAAMSSFTLDPDRLFVASPYEDLDYCFVWVDGAPQDQFGIIEFWRGSFMAAPGSPANIVHHPAGRPKRGSLEKNKVIELGLEEVLIHYTSDTEPGSSGSPVFNDDWRLFALHHASSATLSDDLRKRVSQAGFQTDILNEGIKTAAIAIDIDRRTENGPDRNMARQVQANLCGTDSRTGFFGTLGRSQQGSDGLEAVVNAYRGAPSDIDIGFWNIEWFNRNYRTKINDVARIIADLNLDIWAFEETSPEATEALVRKMQHDFGLEFEFAASEPDASSHKQTTTVMWNRRTVRGERRDWPREVDQLLRLRSDDPDASRFEAVEGKIFDRYPGLFRFETPNGSADRPSFDFYLVPLHLKAKAEGAKRRRMASKVLAAAVQMMNNGAAADHDWVIGGDMNAELSTGQFDSLRNAGFKAMSAQDERGGAITYLGARYRSLIDSIFLSPSLTQRTDDNDFMILAPDRADPGFIDRVSDHRPVMIRLSRGDAPGNGDLAGGPDDASEERTLQEFLNEFSDDPPGVLEELAQLLRQR